MFGPAGQKFAFRDDQCSFSDANSDYSWAFEGVVKDGDRIVFATSDREVAGRVHGDQIDCEGIVNIVARDNTTKQPVASPGRLMPLEEILNPPHPSSRPRPVPLARPK